MELYSRELTLAMARYAEVGVIALPGQPDGRPPKGTSLALFMCRAAAQLMFRARRYDAVHFGDFVIFPLAVWTRLVAPRTRRLLTVHGLDLLFGQRRGWKSRIYRGYMKLALPLQSAVHQFIANSSATARVAGSLGLRNVVPIPLGVTLDAEDPEAAATAAAGGASRTLSDGRYVLFVGRLVPRKGAAWFAENVLDRLPEDVGFKIVGTAWDHDELRRALKNPRTEYLGRIPDDALRHLRRNAAVTVMPNRTLEDAEMEGFGLVALEAAANGSLLVASGIEGIVDAVVDGKTGFLLPEGDAEQWARKICELLAWSSAERGVFLAEARRIIAERYSWDRVARETLELAAGGNSARR